MKMKALIAAPLVAVLVTALSAAPTVLPEGWIKAGSTKACRIDTEAVAGGPTAKVFVIDCPAVPAGEFATFMQSLSARDYAGRRVRLAAQVQGAGMQDWGGLWLRADDGGQRIRAFDNMQQRPLKGDFGWRRVEIVLDLPADAESLHFGALLGGKGVLRATDFRLEVVTAKTPVTSGGQALPTAPRNLSPS